MKLAHPVIMARLLALLPPLLSLSPLVLLPRPASALAKDPPQRRVAGALGTKAGSPATSRAPRGNASVALAHGNATRQRRRYEPPEVGACPCIYYNSYEDSYISKVLAYELAPVTEAEPDPEVALGLPPRGSCWLVLQTGVNTKTMQDRYNLRIAELSICEVVSKPSTCGDKLCKIDMRVPYPNNEDDRDNIASCIALAAYSKLQGHPVLQDVGVVGGMVRSGGNTVTLSRFTEVPGILTMKLDYAYTAYFSKVLIPKEDESMYHETEYYTRRHDKLFLDRSFEVVPCETLQELASHSLS